MIAQNSRSKRKLFPIQEYPMTFQPPYHLIELPFFFVLAHTAGQNHRSSQVKISFWLASPTYMSLLSPFSQIPFNEQWSTIGSIYLLVPNTHVIQSIFRRKVDSGHQTSLEWSSCHQCYHSRLGSLASALRIMQKRMILQYSSIDLFWITLMQIGTPFP